MRALVVAIGLLVFAATADAKPRRHKPAAATKRVERGKAKKRVAVAKTTRADKRVAAAKTTRAGKRVAAAKTTRANKRETNNGRGKGKKRVAVATRRHREPQLPMVGQSIGAPWSGRLREPVRLREGDGYFLRRPWRAFGTAAVVAHVERVIADVVDRFPDIHDLAIGDVSAESGGRISDHSSHQSGRDIDIGLIYMQRPPGYPERFVVGTAANLDLEVLFVLVEELAKTQDAEGGVQMIFLDFNLQGLLYNWALENGEEPEYLAKLFQYPHGRGQSAGIVRHEPHHADHLHVRFRCTPADTSCR